MSVGSVDAEDAQSAEQPVVPSYRGVSSHAAEDVAVAGKTEADVLSETWSDPPGLLGWFMALQNDEIAVRIMGTAFTFFLVAGVLALLMRFQLIRPESNFVSPETYNGLFTMHGSTMMYLFVVPMMEGFAILILPVMLGNREMPFPRLGAFSWFTLVMGGILFFASFAFASVPQNGWFAYAPLSGLEYSSGVAMDFWLLALGVAEVAAIAAGVEIIIAILWMRAPGMSLSRTPVFAWAMLVTAVAILFAFTPLLVGSLLLELDRKIGTQFFNPLNGGSPVLWQHLFWIFGHPEVYIQFIPAVGMISMIVPVFARRSLVAYPFVVTAIIATGIMSFLLWVHHMFTVGMPQFAMALFSVASVLIAIPAGVTIFSWIATLWTGRLNWKTPLLFVVGFLVIFVLGGITGVMVGLVPFDWQVHDSYFIIAHLHYVLIGGSVFPIFAALYFWLPKFGGRMMNERLGQLNFWLMFIGTHLTFFPMHILGFLGMPRRIYTYETGLGWGSYNAIATVGAYTLALGVLVFLINLFYSLRNGPKATENPWGADSLEWGTASPPPNYGFAALPIVRSRHPLWQQKTIHPTEDRLGALMEALSKWPIEWRGALTTTIVRGEPMEVFRVSNPSIWPFVTAAGLIIVFGAEIFSLRLVVLSGVLIIIVGLAGWHRPRPLPEAVEREADEFEEKYGIPVRPGGSDIVARWSVMLLLLIIYIAFGTFILSYLYLRLANSVWPPAFITLAGWFWPGVATLVLAVSTAVIFYANRSIEEDEQIRFRLAMAVSFLLGAGSLALLSYEFLTLPFDWQTTAYGSIFYAMNAFALLVLTSGLIMNGVTQMWAWMGNYSARHHVAVDNTARFWYGAVVLWAITYAILYVSPYWYGG